MCVHMQSLKKNYRLPQAKLFLLALFLCRLLWEGRFLCLHLEAQIVARRPRGMAQAQVTESRAEADVSLETWVFLACCLNDAP